MRVLLDAAIVKPRLGGISSYAQRLAAALSEQEDVSVTVMTSEPGLFSSCSTVTIPRVTQNYLARAVWRQAFLARLVRRLSADIVLNVAPEPSFRRLGVPQVIVLHDLRPVSTRERHSLRRIRYGQVLSASLRFVHRIIAVSEFTAAELAKAAALLPPVSVIYQGPGPVVDAGTSEDVALIGKPFALCLGEALPHKNVETVIAAFEHDPPLTLVLVGKGNSGRAPQISAVGWVSIDRLRWLYENASVIIVPSVHEGFGLPVLEGALLGRGVIVATDLPSFREITELVTFVDSPHDAAAWRSAVEAAISGPPLIASVQAEKTRLAHQFDWSRVGRTVSDALAATLNGGAP